MARRSSIDMLPAEIKNVIGQLRDKGHTIDEILAHLEKMDIDISRSALGRHAKKLAQVAETIKKSQVLASAITDKFGSDESSKVGRANLEFMHALLQKVMIGGEDGEEIVLDPKDAMFLATALEKLTKADKTHVDTQIKVAEERARHEAKEEAADVVVREGRKRGLSADTVSEIKAKILGVAP